MIIQETVKKREGNYKQKKRWEDDFRMDRIRVG